jgi:hypothetical protein
MQITKTKTVTKTKYTMLIEHTKNYKPDIVKVIDFVDSSTSDESSNGKQKTRKNIKNSPDFSKVKDKQKYVKKPKSLSKRVVRRLINDDSEGYQSSSSVRNSSVSNNVSDSSETDGVDDEVVKDEKKEYKNYFYKNDHSNSSS